MFCCCHPSSTSALLLVLLSLTPLLALAAPALPQRSSVSSSSIDEALHLAKEDPGAAEGAAWTHREVDSLLQKPLGQEHISNMDSASALASVLLEALDHPVREKMTQGDSEEGLAVEETRNQGDLEQKSSEAVQPGEQQSQ